MPPTKAGYHAWCPEPEQQLIAYWMQVDQRYRNQVWGQKSNYIEVPTDCPQRDERMGYTRDGHVFAQTGAYNFDTERLWAKFLEDIRHSQSANKEGYVAPTIPAPPGALGCPPPRRDSE